MSVAEISVGSSARRGGMVAVIAVGIAVAIALYVGLIGLGQNPIKQTNASGITTISGTFEPFQCGNGCVEGYVQAGARSAFVIFPVGCAAPSRGAEITVAGRIDKSQGRATYRATGCA